MILYRLFTAACVLCLSLVFSGCSSSGTTSPGATTVSGVVMAGPASGASVTVATVAGTIVAGPVTTSADGSYTISIPNSALSGDLVFSTGGGSFSDEATGSSGVAMGILTAHVAAGSLASGAHVSIDPSTTIIQKLIAGGKTKAAAEADFLKYFGYIPDASIKTVFAGMSSVATTSQRLAGLRAAAFSQLAKDLSIAPDKQFDLVNALASDLADGSLDGGYAVASMTIPADVANRFSQALISFQMSANNKSKLTPDKIGAPVFNKVALTPNYRVEFIPGMSGATMGRTTFQLKLTNRADSTPAIGLTNVTLQPFMYMSSKSHTTPAMAVTESSTPGTYDCTVYYVMPTSMSGVSMGVWEVKVRIGATETATFYPDVAMSMGTTSLVKLSGVVDTSIPAAPVYSDGIMGSTGVKETRTYFLFNDGIAREGMGNTYTVKLFTATKEMMTSFPAVYTGKVLKNDSSTDWTVSAMTLEVSSDKTNWTSLVDAPGDGHWMVAGITPDVNGKIYVRLTVNGLQKTTDSAAVGAANGYQTITIATGSGMMKQQL